MNVTECRNGSPSCSADEPCVICHDEPFTDKHADYPHEPGTLYDCELCETKCFCEEDFMCIACQAYEAEAYAERAAERYMEERNESMYEVRQQ